MNHVSSRYGRAARHALEFINSHASPSVDSLMDDITRLTGKRIECITMPELSRSGVTGLWFERGGYHLLLEPPPVSKYQQSFVRLHELGHIGMSHLRIAAPPSFSLLDPSVFTPAELAEIAIRHRDQHRHANEKMAELFACLADSHIRRCAPRTMLNYEGVIA